MSAGFTRGNHYFSVPTWVWNLPSGFTCPGALQCLAYADRKTGKIRDGAEQEFRCYSATMERFPAVRKKAWENFAAVNKPLSYEIVTILCGLIEQIPSSSVDHVRIHAGGDFFTQAYFEAWETVCRRYPDITFWAFTKSIPFWLVRREWIPQNLTLQASLGGAYDHLVLEHHLKFAKVVKSEAEAQSLGLQIDIDDSLAMRPGPSFALLDKAAKRKKP